MLILDRLDHPLCFTLHLSSSFLKDNHKRKKIKNVKNIGITKEDILNSFHRQINLSGISNKNDKIPNNNKPKKNISVIIVSIFISLHLN